MQKATINFSAVFIGLIYFIATSGSIFGQSVQWASKLVSFSSENSKKYASAAQVLGPPDMYPDFGESGVAWAPSKMESSSAEYVRVQFETPIRVRQIAVAETLNPGTIYKIILIDIFGKKHTVYENKQRGPGFHPGSRMFRKLIPLTNYRARELKLVLRTDLMPGMNQIDAIAISDSEEPIDFKIPEIGYEGFEGRPENLGPLVNSPYDDMLPIISPDGNTLYFTRKQHPENFGTEGRDDIWVSNLLSDGSWSKAKNIGSPLNNQYHNYVGAISPDGQRMLLANDYSKPGAGQQVSLSRLMVSGWSWPQTLKVADMYNDNEFSCYHMNVDGNVILMAIERSDSYGDMDLYVSRKLSSGKWSEPLNMGLKLNTAAKEGSVFIAADNKTLYFSSEGRPGYGGFDMYVSKRLDNTWRNWSEPLNLGPQINTREDDFYYTIPAAGDYAYFSSRFDSYGGSDLYRIKLPEQARPEPVAMIEGKVIDAITNEPIEADISYISLKDGKELGDASSLNDNGSYKIVLPYGDDYGVQVDVEGYFPISENINLMPGGEYDMLDYAEDDVEESIMRELKDEIRKELELELADIVMQDLEFQLKDDVEDRLKEDVRKDLEKQLEEEVKRDLEDKLRDDLENQIKEDVRKEMERQLEEQVKQELEEKLKGDVEGQLKDDIRRDLEKELEEEVKDLLRDDLEDKVEDELREELREELEGQVEDELRESMRDDIEEKLKEENEEEVKEELRKELESTIRQQLEDELEKELREEVENELRKEMQEDVRRELKEELRKEMEDQIRQEIREEIQQEQDLDFQVIEQNIKMTPIEEGQIIQLNNIFFEANKSFLKKESVSELNKVAGFLKRNTNLKVEIAGHTNSLPSEVFCEELSTARAKRVTEFLVENGVDKKQVEYQGYGKKEPIATNETLEGRKKNQRVELRILEVN